VESRLLFVFNDVIKEFPGLHELHDQEQLFGCLDDFVELDYAGVSDEFKDVDLAGHALHVCHIHYLFLLQDLDGNLLASGDMGCSLNFAESALAQRLAYLAQALPIT
jgi:hypothetical protein